MAFKKIGSLWMAKDANGNQFLKGTITIPPRCAGKKTTVHLYKNRKKRLEKHPDWYLFLHIKDIGGDE